MDVHVFGASVTYRGGTGNRTQRQQCGPRELRTQTRCWCLVLSHFNQCYGSHKLLTVLLLFSVSTTTAFTNYANYHYEHSQERMSEGARLKKLNLSTDGRTVCWAVNLVWTISMWREVKLKLRVFSLSATKMNVFFNWYSHFFCIAT